LAHFTINLVRAEVSFNLVNSHSH